MYIYIYIYVYIYIYIHVNHSQKNIAKIVKVSQATVRRINSKLKMGGQIRSTANRLLRPKKNKKC